ncbi:hypothetical protein CEF21_10665 [Bacillus sp. FJAT-42376]|uniref:hypothetical protein n=1 Tax=Bacillus sp. FJAT-42376 TaxID=2014076 RepID=UPI000F4D4B1B|nr:hypothetical protein [Bacillus sp. FJAT-42376]AZB42717.1 hypothetical protein CEF21_10665 [Bacillus sp. FJAT-42376]
MKKRKIGAVILFLFLISGCTPESPVSESNEKSWRLSSQFQTSSGQTMTGEQNKIGLLGPEFEAGKVNKWMWHFWGKESMLTNDVLKIKAVHKTSGKEERVLVMNGGTPQQSQVWSVGKLSFSPLNGADASLPSNLLLPSKGVWKLTASVGSRQLGHIVVDVK